jgi:hypothetical protein
MRLADQQPGVQIGGFLAAAGRPSERCAVWGFGLAQQQVIRAAFDELAVLEAESFRTEAPPTARRLSPTLAGLDVIPGRPRSGPSKKTWSRICSMSTWVRLVTTAFLPHALTPAARNDEYLAVSQKARSFDDKAAGRPASTGRCGRSLVLR